MSTTSQQAGTARPTTSPRREVPRWVTALAVVLGLFATALGLAALVDPTLAPAYVMGADDQSVMWAGRNLGLGVVLLVAVALRTATGYAVALAGQLARELADLMVAFPDTGGLVVTSLFLLVDVVGLVAAVRALRRSGHRRSGS